VPAVVAVPPKGKVVGASLKTPKDQVLELNCPVPGVGWKPAPV
jgi:hypothetical protein